MKSVKRRQTVNFFWNKCKKKKEHKIQITFGLNKTKEGKLHYIHKLKWRVKMDYHVNLPIYQ